MMFDRVFYWQLAHRLKMLSHRQSRFNMWDGIVFISWRNLSIDLLFLKLKEEISLARIARSWSGFIRCFKRLSLQKFKFVWGNRVA
jgi:hypothetical protein